MKQTISAAVFTVLASSPPVLAATLTGLSGELWDQDNVFERQYIEDVEAFVNTPGNPPDATFRATEVNYPRDSVGLNPDVFPISAFLDDDFNSLSNPAFEPGNDFIMRLTGFITLDPGTHSFTAQVDDGMLMTIAGQEIFRLRDENISNVQYPFVFTNEVLLAGGRMPIELIYFDNIAANFGIRVTVDGTPIGGDMISTGQTSVVPLPASAWLLVSGLLGLMSFRRKGTA